MAKQGTIGAAQDNFADAAKSGAAGVKLLAEGAAGTVAKAATGAVLKAVKGARRLVRGKPAKRRKAKRRVTRAKAAVKSARRVVRKK